jgi:hypothetical protein
MRHGKTLSLTAGIAALALAHAVPIRAQTVQMRQTAQCVLAATKDTRSPLAVRLIRRACNDMAAFNGPLYQRQRQYNQCLIQNLSGAQSDAAANQIKSACRTTNPF